MAAQSVPVNSSLLQQQPNLANVSVSPPLTTRTSNWKFDANYSGSLNISEITGAVQTCHGCPKPMAVNVLLSRPGDR